MDLFSWIILAVLTQQQGLKLQLPVQNKDTFLPLMLAEAVAVIKTLSLSDELSSKFLQSAVRIHEHLSWLLYLGNWFKHDNEYAVS